MVLPLIAAGLGAFGTISSYTQGRKQSKMAAANAKEAKENAEKAAWDRIIEGEIQLAFDERERMIMQNMAIIDNQKIEMEKLFAGQTFRNELAALGIDSRQLADAVDLAAYNVRYAETQRTFLEARDRHLAAKDRLFGSQEAMLGREAALIDARSALGVIEHDLISYDEGIADAQFEAAIMSGELIGLQQSLLAQKEMVATQQVDFASQKLDLANANLDAIGAAKGAALAQAQLQAEESKRQVRAQLRQKMNDHFNKTGGAVSSSMSLIAKDIVNQSNVATQAINAKLSNAQAATNAQFRQQEISAERAILQAHENQILAELNLAGYGEQYKRLDLATTENQIRVQSAEKAQADIARLYAGNAVTMANLDVLTAKNEMNVVGLDVDRAGLDIERDNLTKAELDIDRNVYTAKYQQGLASYDVMRNENRLGGLFTKFNQGIDRYMYDQRVNNWRARVSDETAYAQNIENYFGAMTNARQIAEGGIRQANQFNQQSALYKSQATAGLISGAADFFMGAHNYWNNSPKGIL